MSLVPDAEMFCKSRLKRKVSWFTSLLFDAEIPQLGLSFAELGFREGNPSHSENCLFLLGNTDLRGERLTQSLPALLTHQEALGSESRPAARRRCRRRDIAGYGGLPGHPAWEEPCTPARVLIGFYQNCVFHKHYIISLLLSAD